MNFSSNIHEEDRRKIAQLFNTMDDSPGKNSDKLAKEWLKTRSGCFTGFVNNFWLPESETSLKLVNPFSQEHYADVFLPSSKHLELAADNCTEGLSKWSFLSANQRADYLLKIASNIETHAELFALVECLASGKTLHRVKTKDVPNLIQSFNYYSNWAKLNEKQNGCSETGVVCVVAEEYNEPSLAISWRIASILAAGNTVLLLVDVKSCLSAFLLADFCLLSGLPAGVLNILPIDQSALTELPVVSKVIFTGAFLRSKKYIEMAALQGMPCGVSVSRRPVAIVYESADLHSAADGILEMLYYSDTRSERSGCKVYIQASVQVEFLQLLEERFANISVGCNLSKTDMTCIVTNKQKEQLIAHVKTAKSQEIKIVEGPNINFENGQYRPTLICNVPTTSKLLCETVAGPLVITVPFRTVKESITMFNHNKLGSDVSIWTEKLTLALEVANLLAAGTVWVNSQNLYDPSAIYGGVGLGSGLLEGGKEAFLQHLDVGVSDCTKYTKVAAESEIQSYGKDLPSGISLKNDPNIKHNYELHIGGSYKKPAGSTYTIMSDSKQVPYAYIANGSSADLQAAISSASAVQTKWEGVNKYKRSEILRKAATILKAKKDEFIAILHDITGEEIAICNQEVDESITKLHYWSTYLATFDKGHLIDTMLHGRVLKDRYPTGVIGIQSPDLKPLLSFLSLVTAAIALGNSVVAVPSMACPIPALKVCEIFQSSGVLGGVVNIVTGCRSHLTRHLCFNMNIDTVWFGVDGAAFIYDSCRVHPKRTYDCKNVWKMKNEPNFKLILESTQIKTTFLPMGTIFAN